MVGRGLGILDWERETLRDALPTYELIAVLGRGTFAVVYSARHLRLEREVAIKRLSPDLLVDEESRERFAAEARMLASLDHPHIVRVHDYVEGESVCALVMERMYGGTLAERVHVHRPPAASACAMALAALHGLEHAHQRGVLHRDVKPENLLFGAGDLVKVADFGIAKAIGAQGKRLTATAGTLGTPAYMAPEQVRGDAGTLGPATDVWAMGAVLYELLAGQSAFPRSEGTELAAYLFARVTTSARPLRESAPTVPAHIEAVVMRALEREPAARFASAGEFAAAVEQAVERDLGGARLEATGIPIHRTTPLPDPRPATIQAGESPISATARPASRRGVLKLPRRDGPTTPSRKVRMALAATAVGIAVLAAALAMVLLSSGKTNSTTAGAAGANPDLGNLPPLPSGWPSKLALGYTDSVNGAPGVAERTGAGGVAYDTYGGGDAAAGKDWSHSTDQPSPLRFALSAQRQGLLPYADYYVLRTIGRDGQQDAEAPQILQTLVNHRLMRIYWANVRSFLTQLGHSHGLAAVGVEPGVWALLEQQLALNNQQPNDTRAVVGSSGLPELAGLPDTVTGYSDAWKRLRDRYAARVLLGPVLDFYGTNIDLRRGVPPTELLRHAAAQQGAYLLSLSSGGVDWDFTSFELAFSEAGKDPTLVYNDAAKAAVVQWLGAFEPVTRVPIVLESIPQGNTISKAIDDKPYHWHDTWVQWLVGDAPFSHLRQLRAAGVIGLMFGVTSGAAETCFCDAAQDGVTNGGKAGLVSHSPDDDGGYFASRVAALRAAGGLTLR